MYHINQDKRSINSANKIYQALRHILFRKNLNEVTITDISKEAKVSRMTFYRLFDNINDILEYKLNDFYNEYKIQLINHKDKLLFFFKYWSFHKDLIRLLNNNAYHILLSIFKNDDKISSPYEANIKAAILSSILSTWSLRKGNETPLEMKKIYLKIFNNNIELITKI